MSFTKTSSFQSGVCSILANLLTKTQDLEDLRQMFLQYDTNKDGQISYDELHENMSAICSHFELDEPRVMAMMQQADTNNDGHVDYAEFITAAYDKQKLITSQSIDRAFKLFDQDGDGSISA